MQFFSFKPYCQLAFLDLISLILDQVWSLTDVFHDGGMAEDWVGKEVSGCPTVCPGRAQWEAAHPLIADPSQTQHDPQLQLPGRCRADNDTPG